VRAMIRILLVLCTLSWWVLPGMGLIDLSVTWDPEWPVMLEAGWGLLFTFGLGLPFLVVAVRPGLARAALAQLYVVAGALLVGALVGLEPQAWWIFAGLVLEVPLVHALARRTPSAWTRPHPPLLVLAVAATPVGLAYAWEMARLNRLALITSDVTNSVDHYSVQGALALALCALPAVAAFRPEAARLLGTSAGLSAAYLALVSYHWPGVSAGFGTAWSVAVMAWSVAVVVAAWWPRREPSSSAPRRVSARTCRDRTSA
jgi:hypothetical protein